MDFTFCDSSMAVRSETNTRFNWGHSQVLSQDLIPKHQINTRCNPINVERPQATLESEVEQGSLALRHELMRINWIMSSLEASREVSRLSKEMSAHLRQRVRTYCLFYCSKYLGYTIEKGINTPENSTQRMKEVFDTFSISFLNKLIRALVVRCSSQTAKVDIRGRRSHQASTSSLRRSHCLPCRWERLFQLWVLILCALHQKLLPSCSLSQSGEFNKWLQLDVCGESTSQFLIHLQLRLQSIKKAKCPSSTTRDVTRKDGGQFGGRRHLNHGQPLPDPGPTIIQLSPEK